MKVLLTGATGFLGQRVARLLRERGADVRCAVRPSSNLNDLQNAVGNSLWNGIETVCGDLNDSEFCRRATDGCEQIYHVAAGVTGSPAVMFLNTVVPTRRLIDAALQTGCERFILVSSLGVYGTRHLRRGADLTEACPLDPQPHLRDGYTYSKVVQEEVAWEAHRDRGLPLVVVRPGVIIGPGRGALSARIGLKLGPLQTRFGSFRRMPYVYVDNCAAAVVQAGQVPHIEGESFNALDDNLPTGRQVLKTYSKLGKRVHSLWIPQLAVGPLISLYEWYHHYSQGQLPGTLTRYRSDSFWKALRFTNDKAKSRLQWKPQVPMDEALRRSILGS